MDIITIILLLLTAWVSFGTGGVVGIAIAAFLLRLVR